MIDFSKYNVLDILTQSPPAVYVDRIVSYDAVQRKLTAEKQIRDNEFLLIGHFKNNPVVPAILTIEALSQACHLCGFAYTKSNPEIQPFEGDTEHLAIQVAIKFKTRVNPGDCLLLESRLVEVVNRVSIFQVRALNKWTGKTTAMGEIMGVAHAQNGEAENQTE